MNQPTVWDKDFPPLRLFGMCLLDPVLPHTDVQKVRSKTKQNANEPLAVTALAVPHPDSRCPPQLILQPVHSHTDNCSQDVYSPGHSGGGVGLTMMYLLLSHFERTINSSLGQTHSGCHRLTASNPFPAFSSIRTHTYCPSKGATLPKVMHIQGLY